MKHILIPTDFSECAGYATDVAISIAKKAGATLHFLHSVHVPMDWIHPQMVTPVDAMLPPREFEQKYPDTKAIMARAKERLKEVAKKAEEQGVEAHTETGYSFASDHIIEYADKKNIDLIVMGTHGTSGIRKYFIGSNTQKVVRLAGCPVLTIKDAQNQYEPKEVVFASNFYKEALAPFKQVKAFAGLFGARIHLLKVITPYIFERTPYSKKLMHDFAAQTGLEDYTINVFNDNSIEEGVLAFCQENNANLLVIETHGRKGLSHLMNGSIAEVLANTADLPVLSVKIKKPEVEYGTIFPEAQKAD